MINVALLGVLTTNIIGYMQNGHGEPDFLLDQVQPQLKPQDTYCSYVLIQLKLRLDSMFAGSAIFGDAQKESHTRNQSATFCLQWKNKKNFLDCSYVLCNTKVKYDRCII